MMNKDWRDFFKRDTRELPGVKTPLITIKMFATCSNYTHEKTVARGNWNPGDISFSLPTNTLKEFKKHLCEMKMIVKT